MKDKRQDVKEMTNLESLKSNVEEEKGIKSFRELQVFFLPIVERFPLLGKAFKTSTSYFFYDTGTGKVIKCGSVMFEILKSWERTRDFNSIFQKGEISKDVIIRELNELYETIVAENIMQAKPVEQFYILENAKDYISTHVNMITLELTERCNLRCKYCIYQDFNTNYRQYGNYNMTIETAKKAIDLLVTHSAEIEPDKKLIITFYGGEPLLRFDLIKQCVEYAESLSVNHEWLFAITTNCTLLTDEMISFFAQKGFTLTASIDGDKDIHDANRVYPNGDGSFDIAIENLRKLALAYKERGLEGPYISINAVITPPYNFEKIDRLQNFFASLEWLPKDARITWAYAQPNLEISTDEEAEVDEELYRIEHSKAIELDPISEWHYENMSSSESPLFTQEGEMRSLMIIHDRWISEKPISLAPLNACCIPGSRRVYVTARGKLKVCERIGESPDIGDVDDGLNYGDIRRSFYDEYIEKSLPICKECWTVHMCALCYMYCYNKDGVDMNRKRLSCARIRFLNERALIRYHDLLENDPEGLKSILSIS